MFYYSDDESSADASLLLEEQQRVIFSQIGWNYDTALNRLNALLHSHGFGSFRDSTCFVHSQHWVAFSALAEAPPRRILEIGTYTAQTTALIAAIFPRSEIVTVDLPEDSPIFQSTYERTDENTRRGFVQERERVLATLPNVHFVRANSFLLPSLNLGTFDLIWMDGGHEYPDVAWDTCNCMHLLSENGILLCDDIYPSQQVPDYATKDAFHVLDVLKKENLIELSLIDKRLHPKYIESPIERKYIAVVRKKWKNVSQPGNCFLRSIKKILNKLA